MSYQPDLFAVIQSEQWRRKCFSPWATPGRFAVTAFIRVFIFFLCLPLTGVVVAQERDDTRRLLEQSIESRAFERERELLRDEREQPAASRPTLTLDGRTYTVERTAAALGQALYLSLQHRQWGAARRFLDEYLTLPDHDPLLVHYARGMLARAAGLLAQAEAEFRALLALRPAFLPARLELARVLFEDGQEREAELAFVDILASINAADPKTAGVRKTIAAYRNALRQRSDWHGSFSFGPTWSDNVNRTSASQTCLWLLANGLCLVERKLPDAISAGGLAFDASAQRRIPLRGRHGLYLRSSLYGAQYRHHGDYNETTFTAQGGYSYRGGRHQLQLAPSFEYYQWGREALYGAWGAHADWSYIPWRNALLKLEGEYKDMSYRRRAYANNFDGATRQLYATYYHEVGAGWTLFGGVDWVDSDARLEANGYRQTGLRLGAAVTYSGFSATLFGAYRVRDYDAYNPLLAARREDDEQNYTLILKAPRWQAAGFVPVLTLRHNKVKSNVDWLYSYDRNDISLKLERTF
ncbi:protein of unknown function DUF560 [Brenneria sp. EniD312]|nr:protein of unknown function DUF560 [Brenneria sp. EniD312]